VRAYQAAIAVNADRLRLIVDVAPSARLACLARTNTYLEFQDATQAVLDGAHIGGRKLPFVPG
jgi:hypothetical protein